MVIYVHDEDNKIDGSFMRNEAEVQTFLARIGRETPIEEVIVEYHDHFPNFVKSDFMSRCNWILQGKPAPTHANLIRVRELTGPKFGDNFPAPMTSFTFMAPCGVITKVIEGEPYWGKLRGISDQKFWVVGFHYSGSDYSDTCLVSDIVCQYRNRIMPK